MRDLSRDSTHLYVDDQVQTFLDNLIIESVTDVTRRWHSPERVGDRPVLAKSEPCVDIITGHGDPPNENCLIKE